MRSRRTVRDPAQLAGGNAGIVGQIVYGSYRIACVVDDGLSLHGQQVARKVVGHALAVGIVDQGAVCFDDSVGDTGYHVVEVVRILIDIGGYITRIVQRDPVYIEAVV